MGVKSIAENTVRNYVNELREVYHIPKQAAERTFSAVPELPMGQQMQVDFGEKKVLTTEETYRKVYFLYGNLKLNHHSN